jgi:hypothetical protein
MISPAKGARRSKSGKEKKSKSEKKAESSPPRGSAEGEAAGGDAEGVAARAWLAAGESVIKCPSPSERVHRCIHVHVRSQLLSSTIR